MVILYYPHYADNVVRQGPLCLDLHSLRFESSALFEHEDLHLQLNLQPGSPPYGVRWLFLPLSVIYSIQALRTVSLLAL
jgi:hypothetical protein